MVKGFKMKIVTKKAFYTICYLGLSTDSSEKINVYQNAHLLECP